MTTLFDQSTAHPLPLMIAAAPVAPDLVSPERVVVRPARDDELPVVEDLVEVPPKLVRSGRRPQMIAAVVALVGGEIIGAAAGFSTGEGGIAAGVGVTAGWRGIGVGGFLGRALGRRLNELT